MLNTSQLSNDVKYVSNRCREFRKSANVSQFELSEITGMSYSTISRIENDQRIPDLEQLFRYCYALGIPITAFLPPSIQHLGSSEKTIFKIKVFSVNQCKQRIGFVHFRRIIGRTNFPTTSKPLKCLRLELLGVSNTSVWTMQ